MPSNLLKLSSSMESEFHHNVFERSGSFDSEGSHHSRSRSSTLDDENLKHLTSEEKNVLMFFEETLDAFEDVDESQIPLNSSFDYNSPRSTEDSHSDNEDIIDLVQNEHNRAGISLGSCSELTSSDQNCTSHDALSDATSSTSAPVIIPPVIIPPVIIPPNTEHRDEAPLSPDLPEDRLKLLGAIPTPVIMAQKISENKMDNEHLSLILPKDEKFKKSVATSPISDSDFAFLSSPVAKLSRFPNNISIKRAGKEYNKTIAKAAVNVPERRAKVLANLHGAGLPEEVDGKTREPLAQRTSFRDIDPEQARYIALTKLGLINEVQVQADLRKPSVSTSPASNGQHSPTFFLPESQKRLSNEQVRNNNSQSFKSFPLDLNKKTLHEQHFISDQQSPMVLPPESSKRFSNEQHYINSPQPPKLMPSESNKNIPQEQYFLNGMHSPKILPPESNKKMANEQHFVSGQSAKYFHSDIKRRPSKEQDDIGAQYSSKSLPSESNKKLSNEQESISNFLMSAPSCFVPLGKTVVLKGETSSSSEKTKPNNSVHVSHEEKPNTRQEIKRTYFVPRPTGFRPQGITVQFSGRHSSEEARQDALRKLGLLKDDYRP